MMRGLLDSMMRGNDLVVDRLLEVGEMRDLVLGRLIVVYRLLVVYGLLVVDRLLMVDRLLVVSMNILVVWYLAVRMMVVEMSTRGL